MKIFVRDYAIAWLALFPSTTAGGAYISGILNPLEWEPVGRAIQIFLVSVVSMLFAAICAEVRSGK